MDGGRSGGVFKSTHETVDSRGFRSPMSVDHLVYAPLLVMTVMKRRGALIAVGIPPHRTLDRETRPKLATNGVGIIESCRKCLRSWHGAQRKLGLAAHTRHTGSKPHRPCRHTGMIILTDPAYESGLLPVCAYQGEHSERPFKLVGPWATAVCVLGFFARRFTLRLVNPLIQEFEGLLRCMG